jgi:hypothetical protein
VASEISVGRCTRFSPQGENSLGFRGRSERQKEGEEDGRPVGEAKRNTAKETGVQEKWAVGQREKADDCLALSFLNRFLLSNLWLLFLCN